MTTKDCIVITGGPSVGKTTLGRALRARGYTVLREVATLIIRHGTYHPSKDRQTFQEVVLQRQIKVEARHRGGGLLWCDRGLLDGAAYYLNDGLPVPELFAELDISHYRGCFLLEPLQQFEQNDIRPEFEDLDFTNRITPLFERCYVDRGVPVIRVPAMPVADRVNFIERQYPKW